MLLDADELLALPFLGQRVAKSAASTPVGRCAMDAAMHRAPCTMHRAPCTNAHHAPCTMHRVPCTMRHAPCTMHCTDPNHAPCTMHRVPCTVHHAPCTMHRAPYPSRPGERFVSPVSVPKLPGRYYFLFGEPIPTGGVDAADREACAALYTKVQAAL